MKKIGIIGGLSTISSAEYYKQITNLSNKYLGGNDVLEIIMHSINPSKIIIATHEKNWNKVADILIKTAKQLENSGSECIVIPCNSLHKVFQEVQTNITIPIINIIDSIGNYINKKSYKKVALLGTQFTMEDNFYKDKLLRDFGIETIIPHESERRQLHAIIFNELCHGVTTSAAQLYLNQLCHDLIKSKDVQGIILGCTELQLLTGNIIIPVELIDSLTIHVEQIVNFALHFDISIIQKKIA